MRDNPYKDLSDEQIEDLLFERFGDLDWSGNRQLVEFCYPNVLDQTFVLSLVVDLNRKKTDLFQTTAWFLYALFTASARQFCEAILLYSDFPASSIRGGYFEAKRS